jgi:hypothetical protein
MSAIELYYASIPTPTGPYYAGDDEDDDGPMSDEERAVYEQEVFRDF